MKLIGVLLDSKERQVTEYPVSVTPVFYEKGEFFIQRENNMLNVIIGFLINMKDEQVIEAEIDAYVNRKHSTISSVIDYKDRSDEITFEKKVITVNDEDFVSLHNFENEEAAICDGTMMYGVLDNGTILVGSKEFILEQLKPIDLNTSVNEVRAQNKILARIGAYDRLKNDLSYCITDRHSDFENTWSFDIWKRENYLDSQLKKCEKKQSVLTKIKNS